MMQDSRSKSPYHPLHDNLLNIPTLQGNQKFKTRFVGLDHASRNVGPIYARTKSF